MQNWGHLPEPTVFWEGASVRLIRHCDGVFCLESLDGTVEVMPPTTYAAAVAYLWLEFPPL